MLPEAKTQLFSAKLTSILSDQPNIKQSVKSILTLNSKLFSIEKLN
jgi:hypothetical protein